MICRLIGHKSNPCIRCGRASNDLTRGARFWKRFMWWINCPTPYGYPAGFLGEEMYRRDLERWRELKP